MCPTKKKNVAFADSDHGTLQGKISAAEDVYTAAGRLSHQEEETPALALGASQEMTDETPTPPKS